jgi:hypothetical protein
VSLTILTVLIILHSVGKRSRFKFKSLYLFSRVVLSMTAVQKNQIWYLRTFASSKFKYLPKMTYLEI